MPLTVVDLFCGAGGLSEGFRQAGFRVVCGADFDPDAMATYKLNFPEAVGITGDLREARVRDQVVEAARGCTVIAGGPPCQSFSQVRNHSRLIDDPRNSLYREFVRVLDLVRPVAFVMENVLGMDQMGVKQQVQEDLSLKGAYNVVASVANAADFGVPQTRERILFVGTLAGIPPLSLSALRGTGFSKRVQLVREGEPEDRVRYNLTESTGQLPLWGTPLSALSDPGDLSAVSVEQAIGDLDVLQAGRRIDSIAYKELPRALSAYQREMRSGNGATLHNVQVPRINEDTKLRLEGIPEGGNYKDLAAALTERYLTGQKWGPHNGSGKLARKHYYAYRRLHRGIWAWTLNTKADSAYHYGALRGLSVREFARLQSIPDRFVFTSDERKGPLEGRIDGGPAHSRFRQAGNAVPPLLARSVASALRETLSAQWDGSVPTTSLSLAES